MILCSQCSAPEGPEGLARVCSISGSIMGDEHIETLYFCATCQCYTVEYYVDHFCGEETVSTEGPVSKERGDQMAAVIARCETPWDKACRCDAHREHFAGSLD
jgi:hypothetical protein